MQLASHRGKVRCGKCAFVFNALDCIERESPIAVPEQFPSSLAFPAAETSSDTPPPLPLEIEMPPPSSVIPEAISNPFISAVHGLTGNLADREIAAVPKATEHVEFEVDLEPDLTLAQDDTQAADKETIAIPASTETFNDHAEPERTASYYQPIRSLEDEALLALPTPPSRWRWLWLPLIALALVTLIVQLAYVYRTELSTQAPWLRPYYQSICKRIGCSLPLPTHAQLLRSDYSELIFVPGHDNLIQLTASVRNLAPYEQALPMLELTLTDEHEQVVAKKVFAARDYLVPPEQGRDQLPAGDELHAFLQLDLGSLNSTGYSLFWFYP